MKNKLEITLWWRFGILGTKVEWQTCCTVGLSLGSNQSLSLGSNQKVCNLQPRKSVLFMLFNVSNGRLEMS